MKLSLTRNVLLNGISLMFRIVGQTWDSAADITDMPEGMPLAIFPNNPILRMALSKYIK